MESPSEFQRKVFNTLAVLGLSQVQISKDGEHNFHLNSSSGSQRILYFVLRVNTICKLIFLVLLSCGFFQAEFEFFEKMAILLWFLIVTLVAISERIFCRKYPFFEILTAWWSVENTVFQRLGRPRKFLKDIKWIAVWRVWFQGIIAAVGVLACLVQYDADPKYCVFMYSLFEQESEILKWIVGLHEVLFLAHAWLVYGSVIYLSSVIGAEFTYNVEALQTVMDMLTQYGYSNVPYQQLLNDRHSASSTSSASSKSSVSSSYRKRKRLSGLALMADPASEFGSSDLLISMPRVKYTPVSLVKQYLHVNMVVTQLNNFAAYNFLYMHGCSYVQMVSDVFQMIQILRSPEADFLAVMFFAEDMMVCMYMLFRCFKSMAFLQPSSVAFLEKFRNLLATTRVKHTDRQLLMKLKPTLHATFFKLGPCTVGPWTVGIAMDVLLQYYICVALWK